MKSPKRLVSTLAAVLLAGGLATPALAQCSASTSDKLAYLEQALDGNRTYARWYTGAWTGVYGIGMAVGAAQGAGLGDYNGPERAIGIVTATKSMVGMLRLWWWEPPEAKYGAEKMREIPLQGASDCDLRLSAGEKALMRSAEQARKRWDWKRHAGNVAVNGIGLVIAGEISGEYKKAAASAGLGLVFGELSIFTFPWQAESDWDEYKRRYGGAGTSPRISLVPTQTSSGAAGAAIRVDF